MSCVPGMPCYQNTVAVYTTYPAGCVPPTFQGYPIDSDHIIYTGPNLPCSGVSNNDFLTVALQKIDSKICPDQLVDTILSVLETDPVAYARFCGLVSFCGITTTTSTTTAPPTNFISVWRTTGPDESISLPYDSGGTYAGTIDWGDGITSVNSYANRSHTYAVAGDYTVTIIGQTEKWSFGSNSDSGNASKLRSISQWGELFRLGSQSGSFRSCVNLDLSGVTDILNLTGATGYQMFFNCSSLTTVGRMNEWDVSGITNMNTMFYNTTSFNQNIGNWDVSNVTDMGNMFFSASAFNQNIGSWDVISVSDMSAMFFSATAFNQNISSWNVSNVYNMSNMFIFAPAFNQPIGNWNVINVSDMSSMFNNASSFNQDISNWDVSNVLDMSLMFNSATLFNQNLSSWCVTNIPSTPTDFATNATSWVLPKPVWGTCPP